MTQLTSMCELACQIVQKNLEEKQLEEVQAAKAQSWKFSVCYDDDDDEEGYNSLNDNIISELPPYSAVTPTEPVDSLSMGDEHLNTILATESDEFIKSCVENLVPNPSESNGENGCDVPALQLSLIFFSMMITIPTLVMISHFLMKMFIEDDKLHICYDDDDDEERSDSLDENIISGLLPFSAITPDEPVLSTEEPDNSLSMGDEHLDTNPIIESDEFIKSSVENLIPIPSESEGIPNHMCDVPSIENSLPLDVSKDQIEDFSESNEEFSSTDDDSFSFDNIDYVEASPPDS
nr:hypothetical protein [Tanacetum cinerariifolium]